MRTLKISRRIYRNASFSRLSTYAENIYKNTNTVKAYEPIRGQVEAVGEALEVYKAALLAAENGGKSQTVARSIAKQNLIEAVDDFADSLEKMKGVTLQMIVDAGFSVKTDASTSRLNKLPTPLIVHAVSTGKRGEVKISLKSDVPQLTKLYNVEYSLDGGVTWLTCGHQSRRIFILNGLPTSSNMMIRVIALGASGNKSEWSEPVLTAVL